MKKRIRKFRIIGGIVTLAGAYLMIIGYGNTITLSLATYRFYLYGEPYGTLQKKFVLVKDKFAMELPERHLELIEYGGSIGHNYRVILNGRMLGAIVDNMDLTIDNVFFDNAFLIVYEEKYLPLLTAMAVMAARELARDKDGALPNRIS